MKTDADMGWAESEQEFTTQCRRAETLARIKSIPANVTLDPVYVKTTADFLIKDAKEDKAAVGAAKAAANARVARNATAKAARNAKAAANAAAARNAAAKVAANAAAKVRLNPSSSLEQKVENVSKKLERASQLLKSMTAPKSVGGYTRRRRN